MPYLLLPRHYDYYAINYILLQSFSVAPALWTLISTWLPSGTDKRSILFGSRVLTVAVCLSLIACLWQIDRRNREASLRWLRMFRWEFARQIEGTQVAFAQGLSKCAEVSVEGVEGIGPYLAITPSYLDHLLGQRMRWTIYTESGTRFREWSKSRRVSLV